MTDIYKKAYTEVLEIIKYFPKEEYSKIPVEKINFYKENMDRNYIFQIDPDIDLEKQNISKETNAILVSLFKDYFANDRQKQILEDLLNQNQCKLEEIKCEKYNPNQIFKQKTIIEDKELQENKVETNLIEYKESFFIKFINFIKNIFNI